MKSSIQKLVLPIGLFIVQLAFLSSPAFSSDMGVGAIKQLTLSRAATVHIEGKLAMSSGMLTLIDNKTGKNFRLTEAEGAMQALQAGKKMVSIDGTLDDNDFISVQKVEAL